MSERKREVGEGEKVRRKDGWIVMEKWNHANNHRTLFRCNWHDDQRTVIRHDLFRGCKSKKESEMFRIKEGGGHFSLSSSKTDLIRVFD